MIDHLLYIEKIILERFGGSFDDVENTDYWDILKVLEAEKPEEPKDTYSAYNYFKNNFV